MRHWDARRLGLRARQNLFDGWQVLGAIGLLVGALAFGALISHVKPSMPSTGSTVQLLQTLVSHTPLAQPSADPTVEPSPSPQPADPTGASAAPLPGAAWSPARAARPAPPRPQPPSRPAPPAPAASATPTPTASPTPSDRPCLYALCPSPSPSP